MQITYNNKILNVLKLFFITHEIKGKKMSEHSVLTQF